MKKLGPALGNLILLHFLNLSKNAMGGEGVKEELSHMAPLTALRNLRLAEVGMCDEGAEALGQYLASLSPPLQHLCISENSDLSCKGLNAVAAGRCALTARTSLGLKALGSSTAADAAESLIQPIANLTQLLYFNLSRNRLRGQEGLTTVSSFEPLTAL